MRPTFAPVFEEAARWTGRVVPDDGRAIAVDGLFGWAEEATWRW